MKKINIIYSANLVQVEHKANFLKENYNSKHLSTDIFRLNIKNNTEGIAQSYINTGSGSR
jgi:hypothetical protein